MKKLLTLLTILSLSCTLLCISGCEDSGDSVYVDEGRLVSDVVINTSMDVFKGMEGPIEGQGFESGDQMMLRAETDLCHGQQENLVLDGLGPAAVHAGLCTD